MDFTQIHLDDIQRLLRDFSDGADYLRNWGLFRRRSKYPAGTMVSWIEDDTPSDAHRLWSISTVKRGVPVDLTQMQLNDIQRLLKDFSVGTDWRHGSAITMHRRSKYHIEKMLERMACLHFHHAPQPTPEVPPYVKLSNR